MFIYSQINDLLEFTLGSDTNIEQKELSDIERLFVNSYVVHLKKVKAAIEAGYSEATAKQKGWEVYNRPQVRAAIDALLKQRSISAEETVQLVTKNAEFDIADYFSPVVKMHTPRIKVGLQHLIDRIQSEIDFEDIYRGRVGELSEEDNDAWFQKQEQRRNSILRYEIELELNPDAWRIIDGETELREEMELDINKLIEAQERGQIKSVKYDKDGRIQIEGYDALAAQDKLLRLHGKFEKDNEQKTNLNVHIKEHKRTVEDYSKKDFQPEQPGENI